MMLSASLQWRRRNKMATIRQFQHNIGVLAASVVKNADKTVRTVAIVADQALVMATPVDTGRARANWIAGLGSASSSVTDAVDKTGQSAINQAAGVISQYRGGPGAAIHITNNLPYIQTLDEGSSVQAPAGFVRLALKKAADAVDGAELLKTVG
jgi:hypothetical protein